MKKVSDNSMKNLISSKEASERSGYTSDYVTRLAREQKITARRIGNQWMVDPISLENFKQNAQLQKEHRTIELSVRRKLERVKQHAVVEVERVARLTSDVADRTQAATRAFFTVLLGASAAAIFAIPGTVYEEAFGNLRLTSYGVYETVSAWRAAADQQAGTILTGIFSSESHDAPEVLPAPATEPVTPSRDGRVAAAESLADAFSDPVEVIFDTDNPNAGVIKPAFSDLEGEYRFLIVPVAPPQ